MKLLMKIAISIVLISLFIVNKVGYSQSKLENVTLYEYELIDSNLMEKLDEFLISERVCSYYSDSLKLSIDICDWDGDLNDPCIDSDTLSVTILSIASWYNDLFYLNAVGYFSYNGHLISISNLASTKFFKPTGKRKRFTYYDPQYTRIDDDTITYWVYKFYNDNFVLVHEKYNCPTRRK